MENQVITKEMVKAAFMSGFHCGHSRGLDYAAINEYGNSVSQEKIDLNRNNDWNFFVDGLDFLK